MTDVNVSIEVIPEFAGAVDEELLRHVVQLTLQESGITTAVEISLVVTDDEELRELNRTYRHIDEPTDVLSFSLTETPEEALSEGEGVPPAFVQPPDGIVHLGDVIISYQRALLQAREAGQDVKQEMALLTAHGVLHLLGYDHAEPDEEAVMRRMQDDVVAKAMRER